jgi:hypothetical protein
MYLSLDGENQRVTGARSFKAGVALGAGVVF